MFKLIRESLIGIAICFPLATLIATHDAWFPVVRAWMYGG